MVAKANITAAKALMRKYRSITERALLKKREELNNTQSFFTLHDVLNQLTGFGVNASCTLCKAVKHSMGNSECESCIWGREDTQGGNFKMGCLCGVSAKTYFAIVGAKTIPKMLKVIRNRANAIQMRLKEIKKG